MFVTPPPAPPPSKTSKMCAVYILYRETHTQNQTGSRGDILYKILLAGLRPEGTGCPKKKVSTKKLGYVSRPTAA